MAKADDSNAGGGSRIGPQGKIVPIGLIRNRILDRQERHGDYSPLDARILSHYAQIREIRSGGIPNPRMAIIYPVYGCNLECLGCEYAHDNENGLVMLENGRFERLVQELVDVGVEGIEFCGGGEPTLHPQLIDAIEYGGARGVRFGLLTNGTALSDRFVERALEHFAYIRVTLDAADAEMYGVVRPSKGRNPWERVLENVSRIVSERNRRGLSLDISTKFLVSSVNRHQIAPAVDLAGQLGVDSIQFKALRLDPTELTPDEARNVSEELEALRQAGPAVPILGGVDKLEMTRQCELTPLQVTIDAHGDVFLCCYFRHRRKRHSIGNIYEDDFASIWATEHHRRAIAEIRPSECSLLDCRFVRYHDLVDQWMGDRPDTFSFI